MDLLDILQEDKKQLQQFSCFYITEGDQQKLIIIPQVKGLSVFPGEIQIIQPATH